MPFFREQFDDTVPDSSVGAGDKDNALVLVVRCSHDGGKSETRLDSVKFTCLRLYGRSSKC